MNASKELIVYALLIIVAGCLSLLLVSDILQARTEREDYRKSEEMGVKTGEGEGGEPTPLETAIAVFKERVDLFSELVTPRPTPTKPIEPTPTETPVPLLPPKWEIKTITGKIVMIKTGDGKTASFKEGDTIPKFPPEAAAFIVYKVDKAKARFFLIHKIDKVMGWIYKDGGAEYATELPQ